jgi:hypothetical protein
MGRNDYVRELSMKEITKEFIQNTLDDVFEEKDEAEAVADLLDFIIEMKAVIDSCSQMEEAA